MADLAGYEGKLARGKRELAELLQDRKETDRLIAMQKQINAHYASCIRRRKAVPSTLHEQEGENKSAISLTQAVRAIVYTEAPGSVLPTEVRDGLIHSGVRRPSANLLSEVHAALRRLWKRGEIEKVRRHHGKAYRRPKGVRNP
jgi:hypothetical protein